MKNKKSLNFNMTLSNRLRTGLSFLLLFVSLFLFKTNAYAATITMPSSLVTDTTAYVLLSSSGTTPSVSGFSTDLIVTLSVTNGDIKITTTSGLTAPTGYSSGDWSGASEIAFEGSQDDVNNALATLAYQGDGSASTTLSASATPTGAAYYPANGHYYDYVGTTNLTWSEAKSAAAASTFNGLTGYLVTITSAGENDFVKNKGVGGVDRNVFVGATDSASEGVWIWDTGPEAGTQFWSGGAAGSTVGGLYENWASSEPQGGAGENYAEYYNTGLWNDVAGGANAWTTYVIEYGGLDGETATVAADTDISITSTQDSDPLLISFTPDNNATDVAVDTNLMLNFSEAVDAESGYVSLYKLDGTLVEKFDVGSDISGSGTETITINLSADLSGGETYYIEIDASAFDDSTGNSYAGINDSTTWRFSTETVTSPSSPEPETESEDAEIDSWKAYLYEKTGTSCSTRLRLEIKGDNFDDEAEVRIGGTKAYDVDVKNDEKLIARFCLDKLLKVKTSLKRTVSVTNPDTSKKKAKKKINLDKLTYEMQNDDFSSNNPNRNLNIQKSLIYLGFLDSEYATGYFGPITESAMKNFQAKYGLEQTGILDDETRAKLLKKMN